MAYTTKKLPKNIIEISFEIPFDEFKPALEHAAQEISQETKIEGFRPGKASYDTVKSRVGEMAIYEHALPEVVRKHYVKAVTTENLRTYGEPRINVTKLAPGNDIAFTAEVSLVPNVTSLADFRRITVRRKPVKVEEKEVDKALGTLSKMQTKEVRRGDGIVQADDKAVVDMDMSLAGVPLEGGQAKDHAVYLNEEYYVPGFKEQLVGMKEGDKKSFTLKFPKDHFQKNIAGNDVTFDVTLKEVHELQYPALDDAFAKSLGKDTLDDLRSLIRENLTKEAEQKEGQRAELELLETLEKKSRFEDIPELILNTEVNRMMDELKHDVSHRGMSFEDYLKGIKKSEADLKLELTAQAIKRVKTALIIREIGEQEKIDVMDTEVLEEQQKLINQYSENAQAQEQIRSEDYADVIRTGIRNRKVLDLIKGSIK